MMKPWMLAVCFLFSSLSVSVNAATPITSHVNAQLANSTGYSKWGIPLATGQIVVTESPVPINTLYMLLYPEFSPFIHVGIVEVNKDNAYVYESSGEYKLGIGDHPPTDNVSGHVRRITLEQYITESGGTVSFYTPPKGVDLTQVLQYAQTHTTAKTPFDAYFNYTDRSKLYCSEFVAAAFEAGGSPAYRTVPMKLNPSLQTVVNWLKVKDRTILPVHQLVAAQKWVGTVSQTHTLTELKIDRATKAELYQRFTANQKLGNILAWGGTGMYFQPPITEFKDQAFAAFDQSKPYSAEQVLTKVGELADTYLGLFDTRNMSICKIDFSRCP